MGVIIQDFLLKRTMRILGIETSCDESAAAVVDNEGNVLSHCLFSQNTQHAAFQGVVPEVAARAHLEILPGLVQKAMREANLSYADLSGVAATVGPGLIGGVMVGAMTAKTIAALYDLPFLAVNHLAAHALTVRFTHKVSFPYLVLLVSGGHTQLLLAKKVDDFELIGTTMDDAVGEAFDKTARMLGLGYPGGPALELLARTGNPRRFALPRPLMHKKEASFECAFSLSGLKTAVRRQWEQITAPTQEDRADMAASFQEAVADILSSRLQNALKNCRAQNLSFTCVVVAGGVAANLHLRACLERAVKEFDIILIAPPVNLCTDNGVMVAWAGLEKLQQGLIDPLSFDPRPRWPLNEIAGEK